MRNTISFEFVPAKMPREALGKVEDDALESAAPADEKLSLLDFFGLLCTVLRLPKRFSGHLRRAECFSVQRA